MMTNNEVLQVAMQQSAWDMNCNPDVFLKDEPVLVTSDIGKKRKNIIKNLLHATLYLMEAILWK